MEAATRVVNLDLAIFEANRVLIEEHRGCRVAFSSNFIGLRNPLHLRLQYDDGRVRDIGIIHIVNLRGNSLTPLQQIARSTEEVTTAILTRIDLFTRASERGLYITPNGTIYDANGLRITYGDTSFSVDGLPVTFAGEQIALSRLKSEGILQFRRLSNGIVHIYDSVDKREGMRMFISSNGGIYRA